MKLGHAVVAGALLVPVGLKVVSRERAERHQLDPVLVSAGRELFEHAWTPNDPLAPGGDGLGPVFNAASCVACHHQGGPGGAGPNEFNVTTFTVRPTQSHEAARQGLVHARAVERSFQETLPLVHASLPLELPEPPPNLPPGCYIPRFSFPEGVDVSERNTPALFGARLIDEIPDRVIIAGERAQQLKWGLSSAEGEGAPVGRALRLKDDRVGRFGWKGQTATLADFVRAACANELGLGNPEVAQPKPLRQPAYEPPGLDLSDEQCAQITGFVASLPRPVERAPESPLQREQAAAGNRHFLQIGCADCHTPDLGEVAGIYSDLLLHRMGINLEGGGAYDDPPLPVAGSDSGDGPHATEWRTPPLWGVADSAPYLHDGRAETLSDAILRHGGQGEKSAKRFRELVREEQTELIAFLSTLRAP
jgi:CxxC motif-containing protein (DUF1111 family)